MTSRAFCRQVSRSAFGGLALVLSVAACFDAAAGQGAPSGAPSGDHVYLDLRNVDVCDALRYFSTKYEFQFVVASRATESDSVTFREESPSPAAARDAILRSAGLAAVAEGDVAVILPTAASLAPPGSAFKAVPNAAPVNLDLERVDLDDVATFLERQGVHIVLDEPLHKTVHVTCVLNGMPWDRAFDAILRCNDLRAVPEGTGFRITRAAKSGA